MTAARDLARLGRSVVVLERWPRINPASRAFATMARTLELLDSRGLADDLLELGATTPAVRLFAGAELDLTQLRSASTSRAGGCCRRSCWPTSGSPRDRPART